MNFFKKIKAGALQYVLVISVIIAILIFSFISMVYLQQRMSIKHQFTKDAIANVQMGFDYFKQKKVAYNIETSINFSDKEESTTSIIKKHWGVFDVAIVRSKVKNEFFQKVGLLGLQNLKRNALYLKDNNNALVLVGKTKITGNALLPRQGVKSGNIAGESYYGNELIYGTRKTSTSALPKIQNIEYLKKFYRNFNTDDVENFEMEDELKLHQSFTEKTLLYNAKNSIVLENISLSGNIIISSKTAIIVKPSAILEDIILIAPKIRIEKNTKGNFQAIAKKNIEVASHCTLNYPTALLLLEEESYNIQQNLNSRTTKEEIPIHISKNSEVRGMLVYYSDNKTSNYKPQIQIDEESTISGEVYCSKNLELQGTVFGSVYTNNFIVKKSGGVYINHLYNGVVNATELPIQYAGIQINEEANSVAKWVD